MNNRYLEQRKIRVKQYLRFRLGILQLIHIPLLNVFFIPIIGMFVGLWIGKNRLITYLDNIIPDFLLSALRYSLCVISIIITIIFLVWLIKYVGEISAREDEAYLQSAFSEEELRNSCPILINKKKIKGTDVTQREFYSFIPLDTWKNRKNNIADIMNVHFVEELQYGGKANGRRVVMFTAPGRKQTERGDLYDDTL